MNRKYYEFVSKFTCNGIKRVIVRIQNKATCVMEEQEFYCIIRTEQKYNNESESHLCN